MVRRRQLLVGLATAGLAATAGCSEGQLGASGGSGGEPARYSDFVASEAVETSVTVLSFDWTGLAALQTTDTDPDTDTPTPDGSSETDALAAYPVAVLFGGVFGIGLTAGSAGLGRLSELDGPSDRIHIVGNGGLVFEGEFDTTTLDEELTDADLSSATSYEGYELYEGESTTGTVVVAVSESVVVLVSNMDADPTTTAERLIDTEADRIERYRAAEPPFDRLASQFESDLIESIQYTTDGDVRENADETDDESGTTAAELTVDGELNGVASSASLSDTSLTSRLALLFADEAEVPDRTDLEVKLGTAASEREITTDGRLVTVTGTYSDDDVGGGAFS